MKTEKPDEIKLFINWFRYMFQDRKDLVAEVQEIEEVKSMLRTSIKQLARESKLEGKKEMAIETAGALLKKKIPVKDITEITGLSVEEIEKLKD